MQLRRALAQPWIPAQYGRAPYMWLLSLSYLLWKFFFVPPSMAEAALLLVSVLVFIGIYCASYRAHGWQVVACAVGSCVLGLAWVRWNPGAATFFIFACAILARIQPQRRALLASAGVLALACAASLLLDGQMRWIFVVPVLLMGMPVALAVRMEQRMRDANEALKRKQEEVEYMARIAERERISRDLHDLLGHSLSLMALKAELARKLAPRDSDACAREAADIEACARSTLAQVRAAVSGYRHSGLPEALDSARAALAAAGVTLEEQIQPVSVAPLVEHALGLTVREAVTNIVRHARARHCSLSLVQEGGQAVLRVRDDGQLRDARAITQGNGLNGMRERITALGGSVALGVCDGLALEVRVPMEYREQAA